MLKEVRLLKGCVFGACGSSSLKFASGQDPVR